MAAGTGVSFSRLGGDRWKIRWREHGRSKETTFTGNEIERDAYMVQGRKELRETGTFDYKAAKAIAVPVPPANLLDGWEACISEREADGTYRGTSPRTYRSYMFRVMGNIHAILCIPEDRPIPVTVLCRDLFAKLKERDLKLRAGQQTRYASLRLLLDVWRWMADDDSGIWAHVPAPPRDAKGYLPRTPRYGRTTAPKMKHVDACLRNLPTGTHQSTRILAVVMRYTGLRASQVAAIHYEDLESDHKGRWSLTVRKGKTAGERVEQRTIPLSRHLLAEPDVRDWFTLDGSGLLFPKRRHAATKAGSRKVPSETLKAAWRDSGAPRKVWDPPNRVNARPDHGFRAAFIARLKDKRVDGDVIDFLVGHAGKTVQDRHYGRKLLKKARKAVDKLPSIDWTGPEPVADNVVPLQQLAR
ncbi:MAG: site-specific integrase [Deltaproteobacteria bacterium]|nr:site-specific integrase [Deltaproteobacteria bacterium]